MPIQNLQHRKPRTSSHLIIQNSLWVPPDSCLIDFLNRDIQYKKFFINVPSLFNWMFWAFKSIIPDATLAKMSVVGTGRRAIHKALGPYINDDKLPRRYGGQAQDF